MTLVDEFEGVLALKIWGSHFYQYRKVWYTIFFIQCSEACALLFSSKTLRLYTDFFFLFILLPLGDSLLT